MASSSTYTALVDLGPVALSHQREIERIKAEFSISHGYFDAWIYGFLENKKFNFEETVEKMKRRFTMEVSVLAQYQLTDYARRKLREGIMQDIGNDKQGRVVFYLSASRDSRSKEHIEEDQMIFDMFVSYGTRLRHESKCSQMVMLVNQQGQSLLKALDSGLQGDQALRISKFFPGMVCKLYMCGMSSTAAFMARPVISRLPAVVSERLQIISDKEIKSGALLEYIDSSVLPRELGGTNDCDNPANWCQYADRIEDYFMKLKDAVSNRRLTVKEYELEELGIDLSGKEEEASPPLPSSSSFHHRHPTTVSLRSSLSNSYNSSLNASFQRPLLSCRSDYGEDIISRRVGEYESGSRCSASSFDTWQGIFKPFPLPFAHFFMEELLRWVESIIEQEEVERYKILKERADGLGELMSHEQQGWSIDVNNLDEKVKFHIVAFIKLWTLILTLLTSVYFILAIIFWVLFAGNMMVALFLGFFVEPSYVFPLSFGIIAVFSQGTSICKRGMDIVIAIWSKRVIPPLGRLGPKGGVIAEAALSVALAITQIACFIYYCDYGAAAGLQHALGVAFIVAACIIFLNHAFFFTGFLNHGNTTRGHTSVLRLPLFILRERKTKTKMTIPNVILILCGLMLMFGVLLGTGFLISRIIVLYICTVVAVTASAWLINVSCDKLLGSVSSIFMSMVSEMMCVSWLYITFLFGFQVQSSPWIPCPVVYVVVTATFFFCGIIGLTKSRNTVFLRVMYIILLLYFFACWISIFPLISWTLGLMMFAFVFHSIINLFLAPTTFSDSRSSFLVCLAAMLLLIPCVMLGWSGMSPTLLTDTFSSRSGVTQTSSLFMPSRMAFSRFKQRDAETPALSSLEVYHRYPVCSIQIGSQNSAFSIADMAYLVEIATAIKLEPKWVQDGFQEWFGDTDLQYDGVVSNLYNDNLFILQFSSAGAGTTFYVVKQFSPMISTDLMTMWLSSLSLRPFQTFLQDSWLRTFNYISSIVVKLLPFASWEITDYIANFVSNVTNNSSQNVIILGEGIIGGAVSAGVCRSEKTAQAILFNTPGQLDMANPASVDRQRYHERVLPILSKDGVNSFFGVLDTTIAQYVWCPYNSDDCSSIVSMTDILQKSCSGLD